MRRARVFYVPNESGDGRQFGVRRALADLQRNGLIGEVQVLSLLWRIRNGGNAEEQRQELIRSVREFQPDIVLMQHLGGTGLATRHFDAIRADCDFQLIYHEGDAYSRVRRPLPLEARAASRSADIVFSIGMGNLARDFRAAGARDVRWVPSVYDPGRFGLEEPQAVERPFDVVMVANRKTPRFLGLPGWRDRIRFADLLEDRFGDRFTIYGHGWSGPHARGPIAYSEQHRAVQSAWVSANWDNFANLPNFFSDRLPTSLATGTVHATTWHPGFEELFGDETRSFLLYDRSPRVLVDRIEHYLDTSGTAERIAAARKSRQYAAQHLRQDDQVVRMLNAVGAGIAPEAASRAWDVYAAGLAET